MIDSIDSLSVKHVYPGVYAPPAVDKTGTLAGEAVDLGPSSSYSIDAHLR